MSSWLQLVSAQQTGRYTTWSRAEGLSSNFVHCLDTDHLGFLWVGTQNGLNRFDGYRFTTFKNDPSNQRSLSGNHITKIFKDQQDRLWIGTTRGLNLLDTTNGTFQRIFLDTISRSQFEISEIFEDKTGRLWIGTFGFGIYRIDAVNLESAESIRHFGYSEVDNLGLGQPRINKMAETSEGKILLGTSRGLDLLDPVTGVFTHYQPKGHVRDITPRKEGGFLFSVSTKGLFHLNTDQVVEPFNTFDCVDFRTFLPAPKFDHSNIHDLQYTSEEDLWIATDAGVYLLKNNAEQFLHFHQSMGNPDALPIDDVSGLHLDPEGHLWIASYGGISLWRGFRLPFEYIRHNPYNPSSLTAGLVRSIEEDDNGFLWLAIMGQGLDRLGRDPVRGWSKLAHIPVANNPNQGLQISNIWSIDKDRDGMIWLGGDKGNGLNRLDPVTGSFKYFVPNENKDNSLLSNRIGKIKIDANNNLWIGNLGSKGLTKFDPKLQTAKHFLHEENDQGSISNNRIHNILEDSEGSIWIGTFSGLNRYDPLTSRFDRFNSLASDSTTLSNDLIITMFESRDKKLWIGTDQGINIYNPADETFTRFFADDQVLGSRILGITEDHLGFIWICTDQGLARIDVEALSNSNGESLESHLLFFDEEDGLGGGTFWPNTIFKSQHTNDIFFGTSNGFNIIHPGFVKNRQAPPELCLSKSARINTKLGKSREIVDPMIGFKSKITLDRSDKLLTLFFTDLDFANANRSSYEYRLTNLNDQWLPLVNRELALANIPAGSFELQVRSISPSDGKIQSLLKIQMIPPWWNSKSAYILYFSGMALIFFLVRKLELNRRNHKQKAEVASARAEEQARQAELLLKKNKEILDVQGKLIMQEKMASLGQMTAGIAHEIKNPLNFVTNFAEGSLELLQELESIVIETKNKYSDKQIKELEALVSDLKQNALDIRSNGGRADSIVYSMMLHARGDRGELQKTDINNLISENVNLAYHGFRASHSDFQIRLEEKLAIDLPEIAIYRQDLGRSFLNILNNGCYAIYQRAKNGDQIDYLPKLSITTSVVKNQIQVLIRDNGVGISKEMKDRIFDPFFTTKPTGAGNSGLGLSICYDIIVKLHNGVLEVASRPMEFTEFKILLPTE